MSLRSVIRPVSGLLLAGVAATSVACQRLDVFVFRPAPVDDLSADLMAHSEIPAGYRQELVSEVVSADGTVVNAYLLTHTDGDGTPAHRHRYGILYCHGNNTHIGDTPGRVDVLWKMGYTVLIHDPRGYGKTRGAQTEAGVLADTAAARAYLEGRSDLGMSPERVALYGRSLGTGICSGVSVQRPPRVLVLESPISPVQRIIDDSLILDTPVDWYTDSRFDNFANAQRLDGTALLVQHGDGDDYVQPAYGRRIHELAQGHASPNEFDLVAGRDHGTVPCASDAEGDFGFCRDGFSDAYRTRIASFIDAGLSIAPP